MLQSTWLHGDMHILWISTKLFVKQRSRMMLFLFQASLTCSIHISIIRSTRYSFWSYSFLVSPECMKTYGHFMLRTLTSHIRSILRIWIWYMFV